MVGSIEADVLMHERPHGRGYVRLQESGNGPWSLTTSEGAPATFHAHEFHYSTLVNFRREYPYAYRVLRGTGIDGAHDGLLHRNMLASFCHLRDVAANHWTQRFVAYVRSVRTSLKYAASV